MNFNVNNHNICLNYLSTFRSEVDTYALETFNYLKLVIIITICRV